MSCKQTLRRRHSSLADCDIVKKGVLHMKRPPKNLKIRLKTWQTRYFVLRDDSYDQGCRLEIYQNEASWESGRHGNRIIIDLRQVSNIEEYRESRSFPFSLTVTRRGQSPLILGTSCETELREWVVAVQLLACKTSCSKNLSMINNRVPPTKSGLSLSLSLNDSLSTISNRNNLLNTSFDSCVSSYYNPAPGGVHMGLRSGRPTAPVSSCPPTPGKDHRKWGYPVEVLPCGGAQRNRLSGEYRMSVVGDVIVLRRHEDDMDVISWGLIHIRKFKAEDVRAEPGQEVVTLEANIHCGHREGTYMFKTAFGRDLIARVREAVRLMSMRRTFGSQSKEPSSPHGLHAKFGLRRKSESEPALDIRPSPSQSREASPDCPPLQMAPRPDVNNGYPSNRSQGSPTTWSRESSLGLEDDLPPPYLEVLAADDDFKAEILSHSPTPPPYKGQNISSESGSDNVSDKTDPEEEIDDNNSSFDANPMTYSRMTSCRASIDSCPDVPPPPPPRPSHSLVTRKLTLDMIVPGDQQFTGSNRDIPPPLPPRDF